ncbi:MAG: PIN domain-containing protein, partial [Cyanobacteria bacterium J06631_2]
KKFIDTTKRANKRILKELEETKNQYPDLIEKDIYRDRISDLFEDKIGCPHTEEKLQEIHIQCKSRFEQKIPPGYKDKNKSEEQKQYGDAILWLQIIEYAKSDSKPIIFVTDDSKDDWWKRHQGKTISPRTELIEEMKNEANVDFWMYTGDRFLMYAEDYLKLNEQPEAIEEAEEVRINDASVELAKIAQSISFSPALVEQLDRHEQSMQETANSARKAMEFLQFKHDETLLKVVENLKNSLHIPDIANYYPNYQIFKNISGLNVESNDTKGSDDD